jgi:hypothetical protein
MKKIFIILSVLLVFVSSCSLVGEDGKDGENGADGVNGIRFLKSYSGSLAVTSYTAPGNVEVNVPEIKGKPGSTYVLAYWALASTNIWIPCADGWLDDVDYYKSCWVSWTYGKVWLNGFSTGSYLYRIDVYGQ